MTGACIVRLRRGKKRCSLFLIMQKRKKEAVTKDHGNDSLWCGVRSSAAVRGGRMRLGIVLHPQGTPIFVGILKCRTRTRKASIMGSASSGGQKGRGVGRKCLRWRDHLETQAAGPLRLTSKWEKGLGSTAGTGTSEVFSPSERQKVETKDIDRRKLFNLTQKSELEREGSKPRRGLRRTNVRKIKLHVSAEGMEGELMKERRGKSTWDQKRLIIA